MKRHVTAVHENKKPFKCEICDYSFSQKGGLEQHVAAIHEKKKLYKCDICDKEFTLKQNMSRHVASIHDKMWRFTMKKYELFVFK